MQSKIKISFSQAALGDKISVDTIEGPVKIKISPGTQAGDTYKIRGKGIKKTERMRIGDHLVEIRVTTPQHLSRQQKKAIEDLKDLGL